MQRQDAAKSLPNINAVIPNLTSPVSSSQLIQQGQPGGQLMHQLPPQQQLILRSPSSSNNNIQSPLLLQPQNLHHLSRYQMQSTAGLVNKASTESLKPRSYSASSEMLLSNAQYKFNQNTRALVGSPIHQYPR